MARKLTLLRSQRNRVYEMLRDVGLEPAEFSWAREEMVVGIVVSRLNYRRGEYYFQFSSYEMSSWCVLCPGRYRSVEHEHPMNWREQEASFLAWAQCLRREVASPDPWAALARYTVALGVAPSDSTVNEPISACEAEHIAQRLRSLAERIEKEFQPGSNEASLVRAKLDYLAQAARRQRSQDWLYTAIGVCVTTAMLLSIDDGRVRLLWEDIGGQLGSVIHLPPAAYPLVPA